jgi:PAS domain S-box-containing protein
MDVTARRRERCDAREREARFHEIVENLDEVFFVADSKSGTISYLSPSYEAVFGRPRTHLATDPIDWANAIHHDDRARVLALLATPSESRHDDAFRVVRSDGAIRNVRTSFRPIRDVSGDVVRVVGITRDVTEQLQLEEQLQQAQKLESLGFLAGGVAHDFNNILAVISANTGMIGEAICGEDRDLIGEVENAVTRGAALTHQLLAFSRRQLVAPVVLDLNSTVEETRKMLRRIVGDDVKLSCSLDPELRHATLDIGSIVQVLMNLAVNARDAMPLGGSLTLTTRNVGNEILLEVSDTGCGMNADVQARIFDPFFTTKAVGKGTGLGMSVVQGIVRQSNGRIELESAVGVGTTFRIYFPTTDTALELSKDVVAIDASGTEEVLLVDDDRYVRSSAARALRARGYTVLEAGDGEAALAILALRATIALLVTDVVMPNMDGRALVDAARKQRPDLKVLYISGYTDDAIVQHGVLQSEVPFLEKPFRNCQLAWRVRGMIDGPRVAA